jgi:hypothetical protein
MPPPDWDEIFGRPRPLTPAPVPGRPAPASDANTVPEQVFPYALNPLAVLVGIPLFGLGAMFFWDKAESDHRGLSINGLIHLSPEQAPWFYYALALTSAALVGVAVVLGIPQLFIRRRIVLTDQTITLPGWGWSRKHYVLAAQDIERFKLTAYQKYMFLKIYARDGRSFSVNSSWLPDPEQIRTIATWVADRAPIEF